MSDFQTTVSTAYLESLKAVDKAAREYLRVHGDFLVREAEQGREFNHYISPRVGNAYKELMFRVEKMDDYDA